MKKLTALFLAVLMATSMCLMSCGSTASTDESGINTDSSGMHHAEIVVKDYGTIKLELNGNEAPITVANFIKLAKSGFYDGLTFHRIIEGFMMQGGDPNGDGTGNSDETIKGEFSKNGVNNPLSHTKGAISMGRRSTGYDTATCQFFICHVDRTDLDGYYACFGYVTEGMDIVDKICTDAKPIDNNGTIKKSEQPVIEKITIID